MEELRQPGFTEGTEPTLPYSAFPSVPALLEYKYKIKILKCDKSQKWLRVLAELPKKRKKREKRRRAELKMRRLPHLEDPLQNARFNSLILLYEKNPSGSYAHLYIWRIFWQFLPF